MTEEKKKEETSKVTFQIMENNAEDMFFKYRRECEKIELALIETFPEEKEKIRDVLYQEGDGIVVLYDEQSNLNISLLDFINGCRN